MYPYQNRPHVSLSEQATGPFLSALSDTDTLTQMYATTHSYFMHTRAVRTLLWFDAFFDGHAV